MKTAAIESLSPAERRELLKRLLREKQQQAELRYPLAAGQRSIWFLHRLAPESSSYNIGFSMRVSPPADVDALQRAVDRLVREHDSLRTVIDQDSGEPVQVVRSESQVRIEELDLGAADESVLYGRIQAGFEQPFDLETGPMMRVAIFQRREDQVLLIAVHHIVLDAWSTWILIDELRRLYTEETIGRVQDSPPPEGRYCDFVRWQSDMIESTAGEQQWNYWKERLAPPLPVLNLPIDYARGSVWRYRGKSITLILQGSELHDLRLVAQSRGTTLFNVLLAAWYAWLRHITAQNDLLVGCPVSGRIDDRFAGTIGCFINTLPLRVNLAGNPPFVEVLSRVKHALVEGLANQEYPFALTVQKLNPSRDPARSPLLETMFNHYRPQSRSLSEQLFLAAFRKQPVPFGNSNITFLPVPERQGYFDLGWEGAEIGEAVIGQFTYNSDLFSSETAEHLVHSFHTLLQQIVKYPERRILGLSTPDLEREEIEL